MEIIKRIIKIPLYIVWMAISLTVVVPVIYWVMTGEDFISDVRLKLNSW